MAKPHPAFLYDEEQFQAQGDPSGLTTMDGAARYIKTTYQNAVSKAARFSYDGMWRSAGSGIMRGIAIAAGLSFVAAIGVGVIASGAGQVTLLEGIGGAMGDALKMALTPSISLPILAIGAAGGALYDISQHRDAVQKDLIKTRQAMRQYASGTLTPQQAKELEGPDRGPPDDPPQGGILVPRTGPKPTLDPAQALPENQADIKALIDQEARRSKQQAEDLESLAGEHQQEMKQWTAQYEARKNNNKKNNQQGWGLW